MHYAYNTENISLQIFFYFIIRWLAIESVGNNIKSATVCFLVSHDLENIQQCKTFLMSFKASSMIKLQYIVNSVMCFIFILWYDY